MSNTRGTNKCARAPTATASSTNIQTRSSETSENIQNPDITIPGVSHIENPQPPSNILPAHVSSESTFASTEGHSVETQDTFVSSVSTSTVGSSIEKDCSDDFSDILTEFYNLDDKGSTPWKDSGIPAAPHFNAHQLVFHQRETAQTALEVSVRPLIRYNIAKIE